MKVSVMKGGTDNKKDSLSISIDVLTLFNHYVTSGNDINHCVLINIIFAHLSVCQRQFFHY